MTKKISKIRMNVKGDEPKGNIIYSSGTCPLGFCDIVLENHYGLVEVIVNVIGTYNSGIGLTNVGASRTVYSQNR